MSDLCPVCEERPADAAFGGCCTQQCERVHLAAKDEETALRSQCPEVGHG